MNNLSDIMQARLDKWRKNEPKEPPKIHHKGLTPVYIARRGSGDEYEEEVILQEQKNKELNGKSTSR